jgi:SulP family sulfate permease
MHNHSEGKNSFLHFFLPFLAWLPLINKNSLKADLIAGITGAVIVLPQGVAFATIAGLPPEYGLYTAMVTPIVAALFGSSLHLVSGPTTAISIVVFSAVSNFAEPTTPEFIEAALTITFLAGVYQLVFAIARAGVLVNFVSHTVVIGFTAGAAILIATSQMKNVLGIQIPSGDTFIHTWYLIVTQLNATNGAVLLIALITIAISLSIKKIAPRLPHMLIAMIMGSIAAYFIGAAEHHVKLIGTINGSLPSLSIPDFNPSTLKKLAPQAFAIALLGLIEAVSISRAIATKSHQRIDSNQEFFGQGMSNLVGSFFSSYAGSGSFTRSGVNYSVGAQTPISAIFAAIFLAIIVLQVGDLIAYLPIAAMGGVILLVAYNLIDIEAIKKILATSKTETAILLTTFFATLFLDLEFAIYMGVLLSLILFLARTSMPDVVSMAPDRDPETNKRTLVKNAERFHLEECPQLKIIRIDMSIYFGSSNHIQNQLFKISSQGHKHILILGSSINFIDLTGAEMLEHEAERLKDEGGGLYFAEIKAKVCDFIRKGQFMNHIGREYFFEEKKDALHKITTIAIDHSICHTCTKRVFNECDEAPLLPIEQPLQWQPKPTTA